MGGGEESEEEAECGRWKVDGGRWKAKSEAGEDVVWQS